MSIWCSWPEIGTEVRSRLDEDEHGQPVLIAVPPHPSPERGLVVSYATGWSNHYPDPVNGPERPSSVSLAHMPVWCVPGHNGEDDHDEVGPWLRLDILAVDHDYHAGGKPTGTVHGESVILDEEAARSLVADLVDWLARPKAHPLAAEETP